MTEAQALVSSTEAGGQAVTMSTKPALPEPRMWYDHTTQRCIGMATMGGTNEPLWDASDMHAFRAEGVAAPSARSS